MLLFSENKCADILVKNTNKYVQRAVEDLRKDFLAVSYLTELPTIVEDETDCCLIIEENAYPNADPVTDESFSVTCRHNKVRICANTYLGTMWGIYAFSEKILGVSPCYLFNDLAPERKEELAVADFSWLEKPERASFRGFFINDEDLLTGWKDGGGPRFIDYRFYQTTVPKQVMDMVVETALRLRINLIIPATFLDLENPPEKALADAVAERGIFLSQHHLEPLGVSHFTFDNYCKKHHINGQFSYISDPETMDTVWAHYAKKWAEYDNVVWQVGLRGKLDRPVWEEANPSDAELKNFAGYISGAVKKQKELVLQATEGKAKYFTSTLWMEGSALMEKGFLDLGADTIVVFSDNGPNQMFGKDYETVPRCADGKYGIYYHVQYFDMGPHLVPQTGVEKMYYNIKRSKQKGDDSYYILNVSNIREFVFEIEAYARMLWNFTGFSPENYLTEQSQIFGEFSAQAQEFIQRFYDNLPCLPTEYLQYVYAKYFNYDYEEVSPGIKNFILKDGLILGKGWELIRRFFEELPSPLYSPMYEKLKATVGIYEDLAKDLEKWSAQLPAALKQHVACKWWLYSKTLLHIYRWYVSLYEAKGYYDKADKTNMQVSLRKAVESLEEYLSVRKCAEYGIFQDWYRGEIKMNVQKRLMQTKELLAQID